MPMDFWSRALFSPRRKKEPARTRKIDEAVPKLEVFQVVGSRNALSLTGTGGGPFPQGNRPNLKKWKGGGDINKRKGREDRTTDHRERIIDILAARERGRKKEPSPTFGKGEFPMRLAQKKAFRGGKEEGNRLVPWEDRGSLVIEKKKMPRCVSDALGTETPTILSQKKRTQPQFPTIM